MLLKCFGLSIDSVIKKGHNMKKNAVVLVMGICLSACGGVKLNPFSDSAKANTDYQTYTCKDNQQFKLKMIDEKQHAWLLMDDHEVYLTRQDKDGHEYSNERYELSLNEEQVTLSNAGDLQYAECHITE